MPEVTMCLDAECLKRTACFRYMMIPGEVQSVFMDSPRKKYSCKMLIRLREGDLLVVKEDAIASKKTEVVE